MPSTEDAHALDLFGGLFKVALLRKPLITNPS